MNELKTKNFVEKEEYEEWLNSQSPLVKKKANIYRGLWGDDLPLIVFVEADTSNYGFDIPTQPNSFSHFAVFPKTLVEPLLKAGCQPDGVVLDPFAGSGTVGVVSARQNKNAILIEISPEYCDIIKKRLNWGNRLDIQYEEFPKNDIKEHQNKI
jgi:DNA modification methylase